LFRTRGTLASLQPHGRDPERSAQVVIIEHFSLRGGGVVGNPRSNASQAVLGVGYRVGGHHRRHQRRQPLATDSPLLPVDFDESAHSEHFDDFAHRFTVSVVAALDARPARLRAPPDRACTSRRIPTSRCAPRPAAVCVPGSGRQCRHLLGGRQVGRLRPRRSSAMPHSGAGYLLGRPALDEQLEDAHK
jgi:hypothetical protein